MAHFQEQVTRWATLCADGAAKVVEDSPWAYFQRHCHHLPSDVRLQCTTAMAPLTLPHLTIVLHTSGVGVGRRHPTHHKQPDEYSPHALQQMRNLHHLQGPTFHVDASPRPADLTRRVKGLLQSKVFKVLTTTMDGMDHLTPGWEPVTEEVGRALATKLHLAKYSLDPAGLRRLGRLAKVLEVHTKIVNPDLAPADAAHYFQALHDHIEVIALDLSDLEEPAHTPPFQIHTFGAPAYKPPVRCSPTHAQYMRDEIALLEKHGLIMRGPTPWAAPCFLVPKPRSTKLRTVIDYRLLNLQTRRDSHPIPHTRDVLAKITPFHFYCKLDLASGFWQIPMDEASMQCTGVCTPDTLYTWKRMPFGVRNGPPTFQRAVHQVI